MLKFVTKQEYWAVEDSGVLKEFTNNPLWHLKSIQDAMVWAVLREARERSIAEIGGGNSRLIGALAKHNQCYNIEPFEGVGQGPKAEVVVGGVTNIKVTVGSFSEQIQPAQFDAIFSLSVVEHVPMDALTNFFADCQRMLKPGAEMLHLIDLYLEGVDGDNAAARERCRHYNSVFSDGVFEALGPVAVRGGEEVVFRTEFATNPDNVMNRWNRSVPQLRAKRERAQSCTLLMHGRRP